MTEGEEEEDLGELIARASTEAPEDSLNDLVRQVEQGEVSADFVRGHMSQIAEQIEEFTDDTRTGNMVYAQSHVLELAAHLLREYYSEQEVMGKREAEAMATAIILESEAEEEVM